MTQTTLTAPQVLTLAKELTSRMNDALAVAQVCRSQGRWQDADKFVRLAAAFMKMRIEIEQHSRGQTTCTTQSL